ncbi:GNAT family N-acetyltransferase [Streptacidiphilus sp. PAMC 29251]
MRWGSGPWCGWAGGVGADWLCDGADWDEDRVRALDQEAEQRGQTLLTVAALGLDAGGEEVVAGFSEILLTAGTTRARQSDTAVLKQHRGRGLGLWVKAAMLQWLLGAHPEVDQVETVCALTNQHMIAINEELGFRPDVGSDG